MLFSFTKPVKKVDSVYLIIIWFCRILGLTFGGLVIKENGEFSVNKILKIYGNILTIIIIIFEIYTRIECRNGINFIYESNFKIFYYILNASIALFSANIILNLLYVQFKGFDLYKLWLNYPLENLRNKIIVLIIFFAIISTQLIKLFLYMKFSAIQLTFSLNSILVLYYSIGSVVIKTMTWCKYSMLFLV
jgi:hypothetical protein